MPRVSRKSVSASLALSLQDDFLYTLSLLSDKKDINAFLDDFLTKEEKTMLSKRLMLYLLFEKGYKNSEINIVLGVSKETSRVHRRSYDKAGLSFKSTIQRLMKKHSTEELWRAIDVFLKPLEYALRAKSNIKSRAKFISGK